MTRHNGIHTLGDDTTIGEIIRDWIKQHNIRPEDLFNASDLKEWATDNEFCDYDEAYQDGYDDGYGEGLNEKDD